jgi:alpha-glucuronidase
MRRVIPALSLAAALCAPGVAASAEDGRHLWLPHEAVTGFVADELPGVRLQIVAPEDESPTIAAARRELMAGVNAMTGETIRVGAGAPEAGAIVIGTPARSPLVAALDLPLGAVGDEGYVIASRTIDGAPVTVIAANEDVGVLYGVFHVLRLMQTRGSLDGLEIAERPALKLRLLNHWDNLDGSVERGYAGRSLWDWPSLPDDVDPRLTDYARANASIGINGVSLLNVNADATALTRPTLEKAAAIADVFRPYGIRVYLTALFSAPIEIGGLATADPLDPGAARWWAEKADEIYALIPDFGGFLVKADSEGQPGPQDYGRTHAEGANMLADALAPHGGVVMWRAFVYSAENPDDRAKQAYDQFVPLDGRFRDNVLLQVKNGPIDFQPREPFHPLFGAMPATPLMAELQITKEYLGFATHLAYLAPLWEELLDADTYASGEGSTVARVIDGSLGGHALPGIAGVANTGTDRNWTGSVFNQANWYAFGRLAWNPALDSAAIAEEWARMTFTNDQAFVEPVVAMMMGSREAVVDYMTPLGLAHQMATGHHYGPGPWVADLPRPEWNPAYYHRADDHGIGFDRTASGSNALAQYAPEVAAPWGSLDTVPEALLLWFHHVPWSHETASGQTLWAELVARYDRGVAKVAAMRATWAGLRGFIDTERYDETAAFLAIQEREAKWWRDASIAYWMSVNGLPLPEGAAPPEHDLEHYMSLSFPDAPG